MTLVDECARQPDLAMRRNGVATGVLAAACRARGVGLLVVSTNEVFSGDRRDGQGYAETDAAAPRNPYGASKLAGEEAARAAFADGPGLWIVRTAWLYGPPGNDFPDKITAAADRLPEGEPLPGGGRRVRLADVHAGPGPRHPGSRRARRRAASTTS